MQPLTRQIARSILTGFDRHFSFFQEISSAARQRFERADWEGVREASAKRISFYDLRVREAIAKVRTAFGITELDEGLWQSVKQCYTGMLAGHSRPELAETFYNSVFCQMFERKYFDNDKIFLESTVNRRELAARYQVFMSFHPKDGGLESCVWEILSAFYFNLPYQNIEQDAALIAGAFRERSRFADCDLGELQIDLLESPFYRNKAAYLIGRVICGGRIQPFVVPLIHGELGGEAGGIRADTLLTTPEEMKALFSFARAYFMVKTPVPAATVDFLQSIMPSKSLSELYMAIGFQKQAKNEFYRDFLHHLDTSEDRFRCAPGTRGLVMLVFTLPSYSYVFKVIRDRFGPQKNVTRALVKKRYQQVKMHDRVGRMADTLEFSDVAFPRDRFEPELLAELAAEIPSQLEYDGDKLIIRHLYIERRMRPLDLYLQQADAPQVRAALDDWGLAIKQLMAADIFPGDLLYKNFGVTRQGKVVFYDYDEICYLTECNFRRIPPAMHAEDELDAEPWYTVGPNDVFPEEFPTFLTGDPSLRRIMLDTHPELFDYRYWQQRQRDIECGVYGDVFPYPQQIRFAEPPAEDRRLAANER